MKEVIKYIQPKNVRDGINIQKELKKYIKIVPFDKEIKTVLAVDCSYMPKENRMYGIGLLWDYQGKKIKRYIIEKESIKFPYITGLLSFRELPVLRKILEKVENVDLILVDGQGILHPRGIGLATHLGILYDIPTIGVAKSHLSGIIKREKEKNGIIGYIYLEDKISGILYSNGFKPLYISPGYLIDVNSIKRIIPHLFEKHRLPEPIFLADKKSKEVKKYEK